MAIAAVWAGGLAFTALVMAAVLLMSAEWSVMHGVARGFRLASLAGLAFTAAIFLQYGAADALIVLAAAAGLLGLFVRGYDRQRAFWIAAGLLYCGLPMIALLWLRPILHGVELVAFILAIVWTTDIAAFFGGRMIGGPKLAPSISPNKTWAGVASGVVAATLVATAVAVQVQVPGGPTITAVALAGFALAIVAIGGDLFESWLKRRAGVKDSGNLLPGHGGVMDRIDGLVPAAVAGALLVAAAAANGTYL